jgi:hypothetical protein
VHALVCHPESRAGPVRNLRAAIRRTPAGLALTFVLDADLEALKIPPPRPPGIVARLWEHTCCEIFVARPDGAAYHEFNLSPSGEWAAHAFKRYREGTMLDDAALDPRIAVRRRAGSLELSAIIPVEGSLIGLAAVVEAADGSLSYWALRHPPGKPDFHHREAFALAL